MHMNPHDVKIQHVSAFSYPNIERSQLKPNLLSDPGSIQTDAVLPRETSEHLPYILCPSELFADIKDKNMCLMWSLANEHGRETQDWDHYYGASFLVLFLPLTLLYACKEKLWKRKREEWFTKNENLLHLLASDHIFFFLSSNTKDFFCLYNKRGW